MDEKDKILCTISQYNDIWFNDCLDLEMHYSLVKFKNNLTEDDFQSIDDILTKLEFKKVKLQYTNKIIYPDGYTIFGCDNLLASH